MLNEGSIIIQGYLNKVNWYNIMSSENLDYKWIYENMVHFFYYFPNKLNTMFKANTRYAQIKKKIQNFLTTA